MIRYICENCGTVFDEPHRRKYTEALGEFTYTYTEETCPACGEDLFEAVELCPRCGDRYKLCGEILCKECRTDLLRRVIDFADGLTAEEEAQLDEWLDGASIEERRKWS